VTLIAVKREVAAEKQVFRGANVKAGKPANKLATSHCTEGSVNKAEKRVVYRSLLKNFDTRGSVYSHRLSYLKCKVRKGGGFFYGKSGN